ncbi:hypothetical protein [Clostridium lacusfryxellense]|uniref:hypothetical protein n=1 Tax=Clostridium lacusfryxellense TaxID=205328 RepID=UPI001C0BB2B7|nr:hypothetical protein [Clostridium lacusfryxellense]MBU3112617.1 hypothetical protein [Clostridium lacusfryxellense]
MKYEPYTHIPLKYISEYFRGICYNTIKSKLYCLDLDILREILKSYYSNIGRHATLQPEIFRSFPLMLFQKEASITNWVKKLHASELLATCIGCNINNVPSLGAHYDFISRL